MLTFIYDSIYITIVVLVMVTVLNSCDKVRDECNDEKTCTCDYDHSQNPTERD